MQNNDPPVTEKPNNHVVVGTNNSGPRQLPKKMWRFIWPQGSGLLRKALMIAAAVILLGGLITIATVLTSNTNKSVTQTEESTKESDSEGLPGNSSDRGKENQDKENGDTSDDASNSGGNNGSSNSGGGGNTSGGGSSNGEQSGDSGGSGNGGGNGNGGEEGCSYPNFPDESCTGWQHTGVSLHTSACPTTITTDNATYDSCRFTGALLIDASNVTITRSKIEGRVVPINSPDDSLRGLTLTDVEIDGQGEWDFNQSAIGNSDYTCTRCHIHSTGRGANIIENVLIQDSYLHGWVTQEGDHETAIGSNGGSGNQVVHNNVACDSSGCSSALSLYGDFEQINDWLIEKNLFTTSSGGYCTHAGSDADKPFPNATNVRYIDNHFSKQYNAQCGVFGPVTSWAFNTGNVWSGNVWADGSGAVNP